MRHAQNVALSGVAIGASVLALGLPAAVFGRVARHTFATEVHVTFTDRALFVTPSNLSQAGPAMITVANKGHKLHVLTIKGPGITGVRTQQVAPGGSALLHLQLKTGSYALSGGARSAVRWLVVSSNIVGPPVSAPSPHHAPTNATTTTAMDCAL